MLDDNHQLYLKYCKQEEVDHKRRILTKFKQKYMYKTYHMKQLGKSRTISQMSFNWIERNMASLYQARDMRKHGKLSEKNYQ